MDLIGVSRNFKYKLEGVVLNGSPPLKGIRHVSVLIEICILHNLGGNADNLRPIIWGEGFLFCKLSSVSE